MRNCLEAHPGAVRPRRVRFPIVAKLMGSFLFIIAVTSAVFSLVGARVIGEQVVQEAQARVCNDLNAAREIYLSRLGEIRDVVRFTADKYLIWTALGVGTLEPARAEMARVLQREGLDFLTLTDPAGRVLVRANLLSETGDDESRLAVVRAVLAQQTPVAGTLLMAAEELQKESPLLAQRAYLRFVFTPKAQVRQETESTAGMVLTAAAPVLDDQGRLVGVLYGGVLVNGNFDLVDKIKQTVFQDAMYQGEEMGTATIFQDDVRISTNVRDERGARALGTRVTEEVYRQVVGAGVSWVGRAYVVRRWYIAAYEPIRDLEGQIIGMLYVGILEQKYTDSEVRTIQIYLLITFVGALGAAGLAYVISRRISQSIQKLAAVSQELAQGRLDARAEVVTNDELRELADTFNHMAAALKKRDDQLKEFTRNKIMESERLALIGQLAAGVAHELNNPLQGIVAYAYLLLERLPVDSAARESVQKIVTQANRCTDIIRGLLDFSRPRLPQKRKADVNAILQQCVALVEDQALFHNVQLVKEFGGDLPQVVLDPAQIQQVFMNILINAAEALEAGGRLTLSTRAVLADGGVEVEFSDTGHGIAAENLERIFDPFFTTKEIGHGTGLGLAISYGFIKEHHGTISVESVVGAGTTFTVRLPVTAEPRG